MTTKKETHLEKTTTPETVKKTEDLDNTTKTSDKNQKKSVSKKKEKNQTFEGLRSHFVEWFKSFDRQDRIHQIIGVIFLMVALWILRVQLVGFVLLILGILFFTGYFEKDFGDKSDDDINDSD